MLGDEVPTTQNRLARAFTRRFREGMAVKEKRVGNISKAAADTHRERIIAVNEIFTYNQIAARFLSFGTEAKGGTPAATSTINVVNNFEGLGI